ncbi:MAG: DNA-binding protein HU [Mycoplasmataceae bacterium]|nr:MAG: DNA-binding protein HU [Mycoplasmataceae bacterium]
MNKTQLIDAIAAKAGLTKKEAQAALQVFIDSTIEALKSGDVVNLISFGTFSTINRSARIGRNPKTGEAMEIKASKSPSFKSSKTLKEAVK